MPLKTRSLAAALFAIFLAVAVQPSCKDNSIYDGSKSIPDHFWHFQDRKDCYFELKDANINYNLYLNLRINNLYPYSNIFIVFRIYGPKKSLVTQRVEFKLADKNGQWLGSGTGDVYSYRIPFASNIHFENPGYYKFNLEQNMRDQALKGVVDVGVRVEKRL